MGNENKERSNRKLYATLLLVVLITGFIVYAIYPLLSIGREDYNFNDFQFIQKDHLLFEQELSIYPTKASVFQLDENISMGISHDEGEIHFGEIPVNTPSRKEITIGADTYGKIDFWSTGNISENIIYPDSFGLPNEKDVEVGFMSEGAGNFTGNIVVESTMPKNKLGELIIGAFK